jgi:hypothetical protein
MEKGFKHLVKCRCILPQFLKSSDPPVHQFLVFSIIDEETDTVKQKFVQCNNCGIIHKVVDICHSEIMQGKENLSSLVTIDDVKQSIPERLQSILEAHNCDLATYENVSWIIENQLWGNFVVLTSDVIDGLRQGKMVRIISESLYKVDTFTFEEVIRVSGK